MKTTDIQIQDVSYSFEEHFFRTPLKFGGIALDRSSVANVHIAVRTNAGKLAKGFGSMPLGNVWSFPSKKLSYHQTLEVMQQLVEKFSKITAGCKESGHPIDLGVALEHEFLAASREMQTPEPVPVLCTLVAGSPFDAALHDAFGKVHGLNCYHTYGRDFMSHDLGHYLGKDFAGEALDRYIAKEPQSRMPMYHLVGALDPLEDTDIAQRINDGLPETLPEWIAYNGLTHFKIKLNGDDLRWDVDRVINADRVIAETQKRRNVTRWFYSLDFNEKCQNVEYLLEFLKQVRDRTPAGFDRIQYIEQPTARDLKANPANRMHEAAKIRPVVIDESLVDLESLHLARDMGYTGVAFKACKGQTQSLLLAAAAQKVKMFLCVQDLTCPGASLIHSAGLAAHIPGVAAIEANARQYMPAANAPWQERFPGIFHITDGSMQTGVLTEPGLSAVP